MSRKLILKAVAFVIVLLAVDRALYSVLAAGFRRTEVGETGGLVNRL